MRAYNLLLRFYTSHTPYISLVKIFRCGGSDDSIRLRCSDNSDNLTIVIESKGMCIIIIMVSWKLRGPFWILFKMEAKQLCMYTMGVIYAIGLGKTSV